jgi:hypothetical protein
VSAPNDGGPAFPVTPPCDMEGASASGYPYPTAGMTLRDYFAAEALPLAWEIEQARPTGPYSERMEPTYQGAAVRAYFMADAMLKARSAS